jgi:hypothetical protein
VPSGEQIPFQQVLAMALGILSSSRRV